MSANARNIASSEDFIVVARQLRKRLSTGGQTLTILDGVDLAVKRGQSLAILGASGSGKSTLLGILASLDPDHEGSVSLLGQPLAELDEDGRARLRHRHVGFVFQSFQLLPALTALENVALPLEIGGHGDARQQARLLLGEVGLEARLEHYPRQLSGGEQQRVAIARAFAGNPELLFADEPTGNLDSATGGHVIDLLFRLNRERRTTLILVTHDNELAARCERRVLLRNGRLEELA